jgi:hypothetical protein
VLTPESNYKNSPITIKGPPSLRLTMESPRSEIKSKASFNMSALKIYRINEQRMIIIDKPLKQKSQSDVSGYEMPMSSRGPSSNDD